MTEKEFLREIETMPEDFAGLMKAVLGGSQGERARKAMYAGNPVVDTDEGVMTMYPHAAGKGLEKWLDGCTLSDGKKTFYVGSRRPRKWFREAE